MEKFTWVTIGKDYEHDAFIQDGIKYHIVDEMNDGRFKVVTDGTFDEWNQVPSKDRMKKESLEKTATSTWVGEGEPDEDGDYSRYTHTGFDIK